MPVPKPKDGSVLDGACSVIVGNTLYSYSHNGFVSLDLEEDTEWKPLQSKFQVQGAACAGKNLNDPASASLFVVGGYSADPAYTGLMEYQFATSTWQSLTPQMEVSKNRRGHSVVYNPVTQVIVMFSGTVNSDAGAAPGASGEVFKISTKDNYQVYASPPPETLQTSGVPETKSFSIKPMLFPWGNGADIALVSGPQNDGNIYLLDSSVNSDNNLRWRLFSNTKESWASDSAAISGTMVFGADKSMTLLKFDMSRSPNQMIRIPVGTAGDQTAIQPAVAVTRRDLNLDNWPTYNATDAPSVTRNGYSIAQGTNGMVVMSGGNSDDPVAIFNVEKNSWVNAAALLGDGTQKALDTSTTSTSSSTSTSTSTTSSTFTTSISSATSSTITASPTQTSVGASDDRHGPSSNVILGITLGTIAGFLALLLVILLLLKRRKRRMNPNQGSVLNPDEKDTVAFAKSTQPSASPAHYRGHNPQLSTESYSSVAILMGRMGPQKPAAQKQVGLTGPSGKVSRSSSRGSIVSLHKQFKSTISKPIPQPSNNPMLEAHDERGVAFAPSVAEPRPRNGPMPAHDGTRRSSGWNKYWSGGSALQILGYGNKRATVTSERSSRYSEANSSTKNVRATQDSATVPPLNFEAPPEVNSVNSGSPVVSQFFSKVPEGLAGTIERPVSPLSITSGYSSGVPESINEIYEHSRSDKAWGTDRAPSSIYQHNKVDSTSVPQASGVSQQPQLAMAATSSDMSWLNLGEQARK